MINLYCFKCEKFQEVPGNWYECPKCGIILDSDDTDSMIEYEEWKKEKNKLTKSKNPLKIGDQVNIWFDGEWMQGEIIDANELQVLVLNTEFQQYNPGRENLIRNWYDRNSNYICKFN